MSRGSLVAAPGLDLLLVLGLCAQELLKLRTSDRFHFDQDLTKRFTRQPCLVTSGQAQLLDCDELVMNGEAAEQAVDWQATHRSILSQPRIEGTRHTRKHCSRQGQQLAACHGARGGLHLFLNDCTETCILGGR